MVESEQADVLIVGAGISGLMAAQSLSQKGAQPLIVEQNDYAGGRLATRRLGSGLADSGAQFFTVRDDSFQRYVDRWIEAGLVYEWSRGWSEGSLGTSPATGHPRYAVQGGMQALAEYVAADLDVRLETRLTALAPVAQGWRAEDDQGRVYNARAVIITPPVPRALALLETGETLLTPSDRDILTHIEYTPCLSGLFWLDGESHLPDPGAVQRPNAMITWIADNRRKGISPGCTLITVHAGPDYSRQYWSQPDVDVLHALASALQLFKDYRDEIIRSHLDRWRYARPVGSYHERCLLAAGVPPLIFAGDAFGGPRIEGAALSGLAAAEQIAG